MKRSPIEKYTMQLHESIFEKVLGMLFIQKLKPAIKKVEKMFDEDEELKANLEAIRYHNEQLEKRLKNWCKYYPDDYLCKRSASLRSKK